MIKKFTYMEPTDYNGVWWVSVFHLYFGFNRKTAYCGNFVRVSVKHTKPLNWVGKKSKLKGIIVRTCKENIKIDGSWARFNHNSIVLLKKRMNVLGDELLGPVSSRVRRRKFCNTFPGIV